MTSTPYLSVVLHDAGGTAHDEAVRTLLAQVAAEDAELLIVTRAATSRGGAAADRVRVIACGHDASLPERYRRGLHEARGFVVAMTTDRFLAGADWVHRIVAAHGREGLVPAVTGPIGLAAHASLTSTAVYACEYAAFAANATGQAPAAPVANLSVTRAARDLLLQGGASWDAGWRDRLIAGGFGVTWDQARRVELTHRYDPWRFAAERFHFSRAWSGWRARPDAPWRRVARACALIALPLVLTGRLLRQARRALTPARLAAALPLMMLFIVPWTAGDILGVLAGPGESARRVG